MECPVCLEHRPLFLGFTCREAGAQALHGLCRLCLEGLHKLEHPCPLCRAGPAKGAPWPAGARLLSRADLPPEEVASLVEMARLLRARFPPEDLRHAEAALAGDSAVLLQRAERLQMALVQVSMLAEGMLTFRASVAYRGSKSELLDHLRRDLRSAAAFVAPVLEPAFAREMLAKFPDELDHLDGQLGFFYRMLRDFALSSLGMGLSLAECLVELARPAGGLGALHKEGELRPLARRFVEEAAVVAVGEAECFLGALRRQVAAGALDRAAYAVRFEPPRPFCAAHRIDVGGGEELVLQARCSECVKEVSEPQELLRCPCAATARCHRCYSDGRASRLERRWGAAAALPHTSGECLPLAEAVAQVLPPGKRRKRRRRPRAPGSLRGGQ